MKSTFRKLRRLAYGAAALSLMTAIGLFCLPHQASAAQLTSRSIELSDSGPSGGSITTGVGSGTSVSYLVSFTASGTSVQSLVIDFCSNDPIIGDTCTAPTGMNASSASVSGSGMGTWTATAGTSQVKLAGSAQTGTSQSFTLAGITNPSTTGSFYARITTYSNNTWGTYSSASSPGNYVDYGGIALSTANVISITARVQETLQFCVSKASPTSNCGGVTTPAVTLGHGSPTPVLDSTAVDTDTAFTQTSTNASGGATIRMRSSNTSCGGLSADGGTTCGIAAVGGTAAAISAGQAKFGMYVTPGSGMTATAPYNGGTTTYGMDTGASGVTSTYGSNIASSSGPLNNVNNTMTFAASAANTTPAGVYVANLVVIATGTF